MRESRRIVGEYVLTGMDLFAGRTFPDAVVRGFYPIDIHDADSTGDAGGASLTQPYDIPYRCLVPKALDGLLVAGRPISVDHVAHGPQGLWARPWRSVRRPARPPPSR